MMSNYEERRADRRIEQSGNAKLKIVFVSENPAMLGKVLLGTTVDISASGLKLALHSPLVVDGTIDVNVTLEGSPKEYFLSGKICWCKQVAEGIYHAGVVLQELATMPTDFRAWKKAVIVL